MADITVHEYDAHDVAQKALIDDTVHPRERLLLAAEKSQAASVKELEFARLMDKMDPMREFRGQFFFPKRHHQLLGKEAAAAAAAAEAPASSATVSAVAADAGGGSGTSSSGRTCPSDPDADAADDAGNHCVYFTGNSLGLQPRTTEPLILEELAKWRDYGVEGHFEGARPWLTADDYVVDASERLVGAKPGAGEVVIMNGLTANLHLMMVAFYRPTANKFKVVMEQQPFPSDVYAVESQMRLHGIDPAKALVQVRPRPGHHTVAEEDIVAALDQDPGSVALVLLAGVQYYTGQFFDMATITQAAHRVGALAGFDLAHAVGNVPLRLHEWDVDFAVWCGYKYLNAGPGTIAGAFVHQRHADPATVPVRLGGWWGQNLSTRFDMRQPFDPIPGAYGFRLSNPPILQITALLGSLRVFASAGYMEPLRHKSVLLTGYMELLLEQLGLLPSAGVDAGDDPNGILALLTPRQSGARGCQLSLLFNTPDLLEPVASRMKRLGYVMDLRKPNSMRIAPVPLYNSFEDVWRFCKALKSSIMMCTS